MRDDDMNSNQVPYEQMEAAIQEIREKRTKALMRCAVPERRSLLDALQTLTKAELDDIRYNLCVQGISTLKKNDMAAALVPAVAAFSEKWFITIGKEQHAILNAIAKKDGLSDTIVADDMRMDYMRCMGIVFSGTKNGKLAWYMPDELLAIYRKLDAKKFETAISLNDEVVRLTTGMLFYYGYMAYDVLYERVLALLGGRKLEFIDFMGIMVNAGCWQGTIVNLDVGVHYYTMIDPEWVISEQMARADIPYHTFTYDELYQAGAPDYIEETDAFKALAGMLMRELSLPVEDAVNVVGELYIMIQNGDNMSEMLEYVQSVVQIQSFKVVESLAACLTLFNNTSRQWLLKGNCPSELSRKVSVPTFTKQVQDNVVRFVPRDSEIGRNDPCPCGSGKKYKKCCLGKEESDT